MGVSLNGGTPQNTPKWSFLVGKPMVVGYPLASNITASANARDLCWGQRGPRVFWASQSSGRPRDVEAARRHKGHKGTTFFLPWPRVFSGVKHPWEIRENGRFLFWREFERLEILLVQITNHTIFGCLDCVSMEIFSPFSERTSDFADSPKESFHQKVFDLFVHHTLWTRIFSQHPSTSLKKNMLTCNSGTWSIPPIQKALLMEPEHCKSLETSVPNFHSKKKIHVAHRPLARSFWGFTISWLQQNKRGKGILNIDSWIHLSLDIWHALHEKHKKTQTFVKESESELSKLLGTKNHRLLFESWRSLILFGVSSGE